MAFTGNTTSNLSELMQSYYDKQLLKRVVEVIVYNQFAQKRPLPRYEGKTITFSRYSNLGLATTALTEGVNPSGSNLSAKFVGRVKSLSSDETLMGNVALNLLATVDERPETIAVPYGNDAGMNLTVH
jgi:hypothetical protein